MQRSRSILSHMLLSLWLAHHHGMILFSNQTQNKMAPLLKSKKQSNTERSSSILKNLNGGSALAALQPKRYLTSTLTQGCV
jgi:hypothetical protein